MNHDLMNLLNNNSNLHAIRDRWNKGKNFLQCEIPFMGGAMSWISDSSLVSTISNCGGFGVLACGSMTFDLLEKEIIETQKLTNQSFGVNLITLHPQIEQLVDVCIKEKVTHIVLGGSLPNSTIIKKIKDHGIKLLCFAPNLIIAKRMIRSGADAIIIEGSEAGGHIGPVSTSILAQEILNNLEVPVFVAGGIGHGSIISNYFFMGAAGCQMGTIFVCTHECRAHPKFKDIFIKSSSRDAVTSVQIDEDFPVIPVRALKNKASREFNAFQRNIINQFRDNKFTKSEAQLEIEKYWAGALKKAVIDGDLENGSLMAGQSVGFVKKIKSVQEVIDDLLQEMLSSLQNNGF